MYHTVFNTVIIKSISGYMDRRRQYRSIAYGTWKVGGARELMNTRSSEDVHRIVLNSRSQLESSQPDLSLLHSIHSSNQQSIMNECIPSSSPPSIPNHIPLSHPSSSTLPRSSHESIPLPPLSTPLNRNDCYSSNEYVEYVGRKSQENILDGLISSIHHDHSSIDCTISTHNSRWIANSLERCHYRSASAGAETSYRVKECPSLDESLNRGEDMNKRRDKGDRSCKKNTKGGGVFKGAKEFLKKMYNSATLPSKKNSISSISIGTSMQSDEDNMNEKEHMYENIHNISYPSYIFPDPSSSLSIDTHSSSQLDHIDNIDRIDRIDDYRSQLAATSSNREDYNVTSYADSGVTGDESSSSPDESLLSVITRTEGDEHIEDDNWDHLFLHLKKELLLMRERDAQILADLHKVESQLQNVKLCHSHPMDST